MDNKANLKKGIMTAFLATTVVILGVMVVAALPSFGTPSVNDTSFNEDSVIYLNFTVPLVNEAVYIVNISGPTGCTINNTNGTTNTNVTTGHTLTRTVSTWMSWSNATASALLNSTNAGNFTINASCTTPVSATNFTIELTNTSNVTYTNSTNVTVEIVDATAPTFTNWTTTNDTNYTNSATYVLNATLAD
ncbi:MAG: hypothetical protein QF535_03930, partial [Anaerolineales bacterium]|nr:hypothetical protein [Anaerolineales bacterium]